MKKKVSMGMPNKSKNIDNRLNIADMVNDSSTISVTSNNKGGKSNISALMTPTQSILQKQLLKVKIKICCGGCAKATSTEDFKTKIDERFKGTVKAPDLKNRNVKFDGDKKETKVNFVMVNIGEKGEQSFPQCCIDFGMRENE